MAEPVSAAVGNFVVNMLINVLSARLDRHVLDAVFDRRVNHDIQRRLRAAWPKVIDACASRYHAGVEYATLPNTERDRLPARLKALSRPDVLDLVFPPLEDHSPGGVGSAADETETVSPLFADVGSLAAMDEEEAKRHLFATLTATPAWATLPGGLKRLLRRHLLDGLIATFVEDAVKRDPKARDALFFQQLVALRQEGGVTQAKLAAFRNEVLDAFSRMESHRRWTQKVLTTVATSTKRTEARTRRIEHTVRRVASQQDAERRHRLGDAFALCKPITELRPADLRFEELKPGEQATRLTSRPFYETVYIPRSLVSVDALATDGPMPTYSEDFLAEEVRRGNGFVLLGLPLEGKTRTLYRVISQLTDYWLVKPHADRGVPSKDAFALLAGQRVMLLLDDLHLVARETIDLTEFCRKLGEYAATWTIAATCRSGSARNESTELGAVLASRGTGLGDIYADIRWKLRLARLTLEEQAHLASSINKQGWDNASLKDAPTPGHITMADAMRYMKQRFDLLSPDLRDILRALRVLLEAGLPATPPRLTVVLDGLFRRQLTYRDDCLDELLAQGFVVSWSGRLIQGEPAYLQEVVDSRSGDRPSEVRERLADLLERIGDAEGLAVFGSSWWMAGDNEYAAACFGRSLALRSDDATVLHNHGAALARLGRLDEALFAYDRALALRPDDPDTLYNRGTALADLGRLDEALSMLDRSLILRPTDFATFHNRGVVLARLGRLEEALAAYDEALKLHPDHPTTLMSRGVAMTRLGLHKEALAAYDQTLSLRPDDPDALHNRGTALADLGRLDEALAGYDLALAQRPAHAPTLVSRASAIARLGQLSKALDASNRALELRPDNATAIMNRGIALAQLGRLDEALADYDRALTLQSDFPEVWFHQGVALGRAGRFAEARIWLCLAWRALKHVPWMGSEVASALRDLGFDPDECIDV